MTRSDVRLGDRWWSETPVPQLPSGWSPLRYCVVGNGVIAVIATDVDLADERARILAMSERQECADRLIELMGSVTARLLTLDGAGWRAGIRFPLETPHLLVDRFADGRFLIVGARTDGAPNARLLAPDGSSIVRFMLGDAIAHVGIGGDGRIWVGWFDEGIGGSSNDGWSTSGEERPPSDRGIGCFDATGNPIPVPSTPDAGSVSDCYALARVAGGAWACPYPYPDFPLLRFSTERAVRWWTSDLTGPRALAIDGAHALVAGGYGEDADRLALVSVDGEGTGQAAKQLARWSMPLRRSVSPPNEWAPAWEHPQLLVGRGDVLHLVDHGVWYRWSVAEAVARAKQ